MSDLSPEEKKLLKYTVAAGLDAALDTFLKSTGHDTIPSSDLVEAVKSVLQDVAEMEEKP